MAGVITWHELYHERRRRGGGLLHASCSGSSSRPPTWATSTYPMLKKDGRTHAGLRREAAGGAEAPNHWYPYISVDDVDAAVETGQGPGRRALPRARRTSPSTLRFAVLGDPQHATFGVMTWSEEPPTGVFAWDELHAVDVDAAKSFYGGVVGWTTRAPFMEGYDASTRARRTSAG